VPPDTGGSRPSDADRDRLAAALGAHYAAGRLEIAELDRRLEIVLSASSLADAAEPLAGLPPLEDPRGSGDRSRRRRRHAEHDAPQPGWVPTLERFRDPSSGRLMRVWVDAVDTGRHYIPEPTED
jgi:hypothetical protein